MKISQGKIKKAQKVVIYGPEGIGKSTLASEFPDPLFIDTEGSTTHLDVRRFEGIKTYADICQAIAYVGRSPQLCQTLVIDTMDWVEPELIKHTLAKNGMQSLTEGYGKGYQCLEKETLIFLDALTRLTDLGINIVITAHTTMRNIKEPGVEGAYDRYEMKLGKKVGPLVREWADAILFLNYEVFVANKDSGGKGTATGGERVMYANHRPAFDAKNRWGLDEINAPLPFGMETIRPHLYIRQENEKKDLVDKKKGLKEKAEEALKNQEENHDGLEQ